MYWKTVGPHRFKLNNLLNFGGKFIYLDNKNLTKYNQICEKNLRKMVKLVITVVAMIVISHALAIIGPIHAFISQNNRVTLMGTELPFFEKDSDLGFMINLCQQTIIGIYAILGNICVEMGPCIINNVVAIIPDLIQLNLNDLSNELETNGMCLSSKIRLRNVLIQVQDFDGYIFQFNI